HARAAQTPTCTTANCPVRSAQRDRAPDAARADGARCDRVARFHRDTMHARGEIAGAAGLADPSDFMPYHFMFRQSTGFRDGNEVYPYLPRGFLLADEEIPGLEDWYDRWERATADSFAPPEIPFGPFASRRRRGI